MSASSPFVIVGELWNMFISCASVDRDTMKDNFNGFNGSAMEAPVDMRFGSWRGSILTCQANSWSTLRSSMRPGR